MEITGKRHFVYTEPKPVESEWYVPIDISSWLDSATISNVDYSAICIDTRADALAVVTDVAKNSFSNDMGCIMPFIRGDRPGKKYQVKAVVTDSDAQKETFYFTWEVAPVEYSMKASLTLDAILA